MNSLFSTSFDLIALIASCYSYYRMGKDDNPSKMIQLLWCVLLVNLPIALVFSENSMNNIQSVSIIAALPIGLVMILIVVSFFKDEKNMKELGIRNGKD